MKNFLSTILLILSLLSIYVSFKLATGFYWQNVLMSDWSNSKLLLPLNLVEKLDTDFPNLTTAALPLASVKMRYYLQNRNIDTLKYFFAESQKANPFMGVEESILSQYLYNIQDYDSAYKLSKSAFNKLSNNLLHGSVYISSLIKLDSLEKAVKIFDNINKKDKAHYRLFLTSLIEAQDTIYLKKYLDESKKLIGNEGDYKKYYQIYKSSYKNYYEALAYDEMGKIDFDKGFINEALKKYKTSISLNPLNHNSYLNLGKIYFKNFNDSIKKAKKMFNKTIQIDPDNGEAYYYLAISEYIIDEVNKDSICKILKKSFDLGYKDSRPLFKSYSCIE